MLNKETSRETVQGSHVPQSATQKVATHAKRVRCVELAAQGMSYDEIAEAVGYSNRGGAHKAVSAALRAQQAEPVDELRQFECERLDALQRSCWDSAIAGDIPSVDRVLRVIQARVKLLGLDQFSDKPVSGGGRLVSETWQPDSAELNSSVQTGRENHSGASSSRYR